MAEITVSKHDAEKLNQEYKKTAKIMLAFILKAIKEEGKKIDDKKIGIYFKDDKGKVTEEIGDKLSLAEKINPSDAQKLKIALQKPQDLKGGVLIFIDGEKIFDVEDGKVNSDKLNLISKQREKLKVNATKTPQNRTLKDGEDLVPYVQKMMELSRGKAEILGNDQFRLRTTKFVITKRHEKFAVQRNSDGWIVMNHRGFTRNAEALDKELLQNVKPHLWYLQAEQAAKKTPQSRSSAQGLVKFAEELLENTSQRDSKGVINFTLHPQFYFSQQGADLSISSKKSKKEIFNNNGFTENATEKDKDELEKIKFFVQASKEEPEPEPESKDLEVERER
ncbi:hypothetical protein NIES267_73310 (plasmid) [Calothrix parasitica NIES-267]|uniref:Uncharacterized protein n=1 Tax=Calothrix parasitica NIES-267 TaxID=1973488 RepID=A0A1Z4M2V9_9CYAN|nr:hypothetical protein NIES267_73310 [Calothrix parasitica NIES-267]